MGARIEGVKRPPIAPVFARVLAQFERYVDFAAAVGEHRRTVDWWVNHMGYIPAEHAATVSAAVRGQVSVIDLVQEAKRMKGRRLMAQSLKREAAREAAAVPAPAQEGEPLGG